MRATVTLDPALFAEADRHAEELGLSRSGFYQAAIEHYLRELRERRLTEQMNRCLERSDESGEGGLESYVAEAWSADMGDDEW